MASTNLNQLYAVARSMSAPRIAPAEAVVNELLAARAQDRQEVLEDPRGHVERYDLG